MDSLPRKGFGRILELFVFFLRFFLMAIWSPIAALLVLPLALVRWKKVENNLAFARVYGAPARAILGIRTEFHGLEYMKVRPAVFVGNHQSGVELAIMAEIYPLGAVMIVKKELRRIPLVGLMFEAFGNVFIDRSDRANAMAGLNSAIAEMKKRNLSAWIYPEGTRHPSGEGLLPFKKGAFYMAIQSGAPIVPIVLSRLSPFVSAKRGYARSGTMVVKVLPPVSTQGLTMADVDSLSQRVRSLMLEAMTDVNARALKLNPQLLASPRP